MSIILGVHNQVSWVTTGQRNSVSKPIESAMSHEENTPQNPVGEKPRVFLLQVSQHLNDRQHLTAGKVLPNLREYVVSECHACGEA